MIKTKDILANLKKAAAIRKAKKKFGKDVPQGQNPLQASKSALRGARKKFGKDVPRGQNPLSF